MGAPADPPLIEEPELCKPEQIGARRRVGDVVTRLVRSGRVIGVGVADGVGEQRELAVVQVGRTLEHALDPLHLPDLGFEVRVEVVDGAPDHVHPGAR